MHLADSLRNPRLWIASALAVTVTGFYEHWPSLGWLGVLLFLLTLRLAQVQSRDGTYRKAFSGCFFPSLILIVGATWVVTVFTRIVAMMASGSAHGWLPAAVTLVLVAALHLGSERLYARMILGFMGERAGEAPPVGEGERRPADAAAGEPTFLEYGASSDLNPDAEGDRLAHRIQHPGSLLIYRGLLLALVVGVLFTVALSYQMARQATLEELQELSAPEVLTLQHLPQARRQEFLYLLLWQAPSNLLAFVVATVVFYRRGRVGWLTALLCIGVANLWKLAPAGLIHASGMPIAGPAVRPLLAAPPVISFVIALAFFMAARQRTRGFRGRPEIVPRLLVLRVFGIFGNTQSLFRLVAGRWQSVGPVLTIADPGYARLEFGRGRFLVLLAAFAPLVLILAFVGFDAQAANSFLVFYEPVFVFIYVALLTAYFCYQWFALRPRFARNAAAIHQRIGFESAEEGLLSSQYRQGTAYCYDDTWREALRELVAWTDVILMDLRGFSQQRQGCLYEVGFLVDRFPLHGAVFLVDDTTDRELLEQVLTERWRQADPASPNLLDGSPPAVTFYRASNSLAKDTPRLIGLLGRAAAHVSDGIRRSDAIAIEGHARWIQLAVPAAASLTGLGVVLQLMATGGEVDLALGRGGIRAYAGISLAWLGVILLMLTTRMRAMLQRDGNLKDLFKGFPWPQIFWMVTTAWLAIHVLLLKYVGL